MTGTGTLINVVAVVVGGTAGSLLGERFSVRVRETVMQGIGLVVFVLGVQMALKSNELLIVLGSIVLGGMIGEWLGIQQRLDDGGHWLEKKAERYPFLVRGDFVKGFVMATLVFCPGPMAILGSIKDGLEGDYSILAIKSTLDGFSALAFAAAMGMGVTFSALAILVLQGSFTLGASLFDRVLTDPMITEITATGGVIMLGIALLLLEVRPVRVANFLPALFLAPLIVALLAAFGLG